MNLFSNRTQHIIDTAYFVSVVVALVTIATIARTIVEAISA